jgi:hypothetical protein
VLSGEASKPDMKRETVMTFGPLDSAGCKAWLSSVLNLKDFNLDFIDRLAPLRARILTHFVTATLKTVPTTQAQLEDCLERAVDEFKTDVRYRLSEHVRNDPRTPFPSFVWSF